MFTKRTVHGKCRIYFFLCQSGQTIDGGAPFKDQVNGMKQINFANIKTIEINSLGVLPTFHHNLNR